MPVTTEDWLNAIEVLMRKVKETHIDLKTRAVREHGDTIMLNMIDEWTRKIAGTVEGHGAEFQLYYHHRMEKRREIHDKRSKYADVAIGEENDNFAKAIQSKSTLQKAPGAIDGYLTDALVQLTGEKGETPHPKQRPCIHITIWDTANPWPYTDTTIPQPLMLPNLRLEVKNKVTNVIANAMRQRLQEGTMQTTNAPPAPNHMTKFVGSLTAPQNAMIQQTFRPPLRPNSTPNYVALTDRIVPLKTLLVKIKWPFGLYCSNGQQICFLESLTLVGHVANSNLNFSVDGEKVRNPVPLVPNVAQ